MAGNIRRFFSNIICALIPNRDMRRRMRVVLNSDVRAYLRFIRADLGMRPRRVRTFVGYLARSLLISVNDTYIYKFPLRRDNSDELAVRERRILDSLTQFSPIHVPDMQLLKYNGRLVRKYEYVHGVQFRKLSHEYARAHMDGFAKQIAEFMYEISCVNPSEIRDLKPSPNALPSYRYGWTQGDIYDNFLIDTKTHRIVAIIDWEDAYFGAFDRLFHRQHVSIASEFMDSVAREYDKLYYKNH